MFINETGTIGAVLTNMDLTITGSTFLTFALLLIFVIMIAVIFRINLELIALFLTPLALVLVSYKSELMFIGILIFVLDAFILAKAITSLLNG